MVSDIFGKKSPRFFREVIHFDVRECFKIGFSPPTLVTSHHIITRKSKPTLFKKSFFWDQNHWVPERVYLFNTFSRTYGHGRPFGAHFLRRVQVGKFWSCWRILYKLISRTFMDKKMMYTNEFKEFPNTIHLDFSSVRENEDHASWGMTAQRHVMQWGPVGRPHDTFWCKDVLYRVVFYT